MANDLEHRDLFPGALEVMILHSLRSKPMHGYALVKHIKQVSDDLLQVEEGSLPTAFPSTGSRSSGTSPINISESDAEQPPARIFWRIGREHRRYRAFVFGIAALISPRLVTSFRAAKDRYGDSKD